LKFLLVVFSIAVTSVDGILHARFVCLVASSSAYCQPHDFVMSLAEWHRRASGGKASTTKSPNSLGRSRISMPSNSQVEVDKKVRSTMQAVRNSTCMQHALSCTRTRSQGCDADVGTHPSTSYLMQCNTAVRFTRWEEAHVKFYQWGRYSNTIT
jgi:hypothetical protein